MQAKRNLKWCMERRLRDRAARERKSVAAANEGVQL
jgi:hypothetical protein